MMRVLITGSRNWSDWLAIEAELRALAEVDPDITVVHGDARGADRVAGRLARELGLSVEHHPAKWDVHDEKCPPHHDGQATCKRAGFRRNAEMVALGADICLAFIRDGSRGATMCADLAEKAGIETRRIVR